MRRPNVLLIVLDAARRDALEPYGAASGASPAIAQLARRGAALPDVHATGCWTVPSHSSMFTGLMPRAAGLGQALSPHHARPVVESHADRLLPEVLRRAGYATRAASANVWVSPASGFASGFDSFDEVDTDRNASIHVGGRRARLRWLAEAARGQVDDGARAVAERIGGWLEGERPFFGFVNLLECHSPYLPPRPYGRVSLLDRLRAAEDARRYYTLEDIWRVCAGVKQIPEPTLERMRRLYAASIRYMDDWVAGVLERLDAAGALDDTLVIVCSDHGENFGEGGLITHALSLDERLLHVPFVAAGPGAEGRTLTSLAELPRFVAECVGLDEHPWHDGPPAGVGVAQFDPPTTPDDAEHVTALEELGLGPAIDRFTTPLTCAVADGLKLLRRGEREEVYDLATDPLELRPLAPDDASLAGRRAALTRLREALEHPSMTARAGQPDGGAPAPAAASADEIADLEERMRLLGYM